MARYKNIPVKTETYQKMKLIAEANGFGERGLGAQVDSWVARELPECDHPKQAVTIEIFPNQDTLPGAPLHRTGWYCPTCQRVYGRATAQGAVVVETVPANAEDPYGQPAQVKTRKRRGISKAVTA
jgi:hypothetical protein